MDDHDQNNSATSELRELMMLTMAGGDGGVLRVVTLLLMVAPKILRLLKTIRRWMCTLRWRSADTHRVANVKTLSACVVHSAEGMCESCMFPRAMQAAFDDLKNVFVASKAAHDDYSLVNLLLSNPQESEELVLANDRDRPSRIEVAPGIFVQSSMRVEERTTAPAVTRTYIELRLSVDPGVHPGNTKFTVIDRYLENCLRAFEEKEKDELKGPHVFSMVEGDTLQPVGDNNNDPSSDDSSHSSSPSSSRRYPRSSERGLRYSWHKIPGDMITDNPSFPEKDELFRIIGDFLRNKHLYDRRGITHNFSALLQSFPGCGKTRFFLDLAARFNLVVIQVAPDKVRTVKSLRELYFSDYVGGFCVPHNRRMYVIEDLSHGAWMQALHKDPRCRSDEIFPLDAYLQIKDGLVRREGHIVFYTTNGDVNDLDPAFLRKGRVDEIVRVSKMSADGIRSVHKRAFGRDLPDDLSHRVRDGMYPVADIMSVYRSFDLRHVEDTLRGMFGGHDHGHVRPVFKKNKNKQRK